MRSITTEKGEVLLIEVPNDCNYELKQKDSMPTHLMVTRKNGSSYPEVLPEGYDTILGEVIADGPQFDCEELVTYSESQGVYLKNPMEFIGSEILHSEQEYKDRKLEWERLESLTLKENHKYIAILKSK